MLLKFITKKLYMAGIKKAVEVSEMTAGRLKQELKIGAAVTVSKYSLLKDYTYIQREKRSGTVTALSRYIIVLDFGCYQECFRYTQFFECGGERLRLQ